MTKVKICGLREIRDIDAANRCLPDYVGFVFAEGSRRRVSPETAHRLRERMDMRIQAVGVFVNQGIDYITRLCRRGIIDCVQLHGEEDERYIRGLRESVCQTIIRAVPVAGRLPPLPRGADFLLFDTATAQRGGAGIAFDWHAVANCCGPHFLAGGLDCGNVAKAVRQLRPYCVDVSSGVETDGSKDPEKMQRFVTLVREMN